MNPATILAITAAVGAVVAVAGWHLYPRLIPPTDDQPETPHPPLPRRDGPVRGVVLAVLDGGHAHVLPDDDPDEPLWAIDVNHQGRVAPGDRVIVVPVENAAGEYVVLHREIPR